MKNVNIGFIPQKFRLWAPPLVGIPVMLALGLWIKEVGYLLFAHHMFWVIGVILLINPVSETFWPGPAKRKPRRALPPPSAKTRRRAEARRRMAIQKLRR